ncbi:NAD(P)-dependent oxidoreductase [Marinifilum sp.]|uniref:NAD(P)-dependent oxidoreductase n=1 Tax=Marinifilum sp. TaxID=2033137 RepID=UPI003BAB6EE3
MKNKILIAYSIPHQGLSELEKNFELIYPEKEFFSIDELVDRIPDCVALLSIFNKAVPKEVIEAANKLKIISNYGVGFNNIDIETASKKGIVVCNTPEAVCEPTAELCLALILSLSRGIAKCDYGLKSNPDFEWGVMRNLGTGLQGKTLGIIGMGKIGKSIANKAEAFGMKIVYHNRNKIQGSSYQYLEFTELLGQADILSLNCPLTATTHHLIGAKELGLMKESALLVNTARGSVVNEQELVDALKERQIAGAALDVFEHEPTIHPDLLKMDNVLVVPHIGTATIETRIEMGKEASENIISYLMKKIEKNRVN